jgi:outer membrane biosynthesis protein TonB
VRVGDAVRAGLGFAALIAASLAHADYKDSYARGVKAYRDGNLGEARTLIAQALSDHPEPATKVRLYGQVYEPYVPQFYLGEIAFKQGDCAAALTQFNAAASKAVVAELPDLSGTQQRDAATCAQKTTVAKKEEKVTEPPPAKPIEPPVAKPIVKNTPPPPPIVKPTPVEKPMPVEKPVAIKNEAPQPLVDAFDEYLAGHYSNVSRINPEVYADAKARYHAFLVRSASKFTLGKIDGDEQLLTAARSDAKAARALDAATPDASLFSPAFRAFYQESR